MAITDEMLLHMDPCDKLYKRIAQLKYVKTIYHGNACTRYMSLTRKLIPRTNTREPLWLSLL